MSTLAKVEEVMRQTKTPMSVRDIVEIAGDALPTRSKTPDTVVARDLSMDIKRLGEESRFVRTAPGRYTMREFVATGLIKMGDTGDGLRKPVNGAKPESDGVEKNIDDGVLRDAELTRQPETTPVLGQALPLERQGVLPASNKPSVSEESTPLRSVAREDATL